MELMSYAVYKDGDGNTIKTAEIADKYARERIAYMEQNGTGGGSGSGGEDPAAAASYAAQAEQSANAAKSSANAAKASEDNAAAALADMQALIEGISDGDEVTY